ncbi:NUDIX hydrolase [Flavihumibacter petaseus]|uniref:GDP-mannose pyrophosphatase n=1 Tax=Flavihumibacter petaseus NBRC 106054 TaxID=1220578 RepID=A0A0E9N484_9BACT|nr:NUDIX hydrolase [Flavihumibacter petaseus]GAO44466.1 putative hydrolase [Flavihumibacter petaseus NBRC 106054]
MHWNVLSTEYISNHQYFTARRDRCQREDGVIVDPYFVVELPTSATALALTEDGKVVMVKQYRHPVAEVMLETPGGFIDPGEDFAEGMRRELLEETGYSFASFDYLGRVAANPGVLSNYTELYLATGGVRTDNQSLDHNEEIDVQVITMAELMQLVAAGEIKQSLHLNCILLAFMKMGMLAYTTR